MTPRIPALKAPEIIKIINKKGFIKVRQSGSHAIFRHDDGRRVTIPIHRNKDLGRGLLRQIMKDADISIEDIVKQ